MHAMYKASGIGWLGDVPGGWAVVPLKAVATCNDEVLPETTDGDTVIEYVEISGVEEGRGITQTDTLAFSAAPSRARRLVRHGDVLISTVRTYLRAIATVSHPPANLVASTGFAAIRPKHVHPGFLGYLLHCEYLMSEVISRSVGISYPAINASELMRLKGPIPPREEQQVIAAFLDRETAKIDALVAEQKRLIELLKEKRQAVISQALTKGLDPTVPMKNSGVAWLGQVPQHWDPIRLKRVARSGPRTFIDGDWIELPFITSEGVRLIQCGNIGTGQFEEQGFRYVSEETFKELDCTEVKPNDVLICRLQSSRTILAGRACLAPDLGVRMITSVDNCIVKPSEDFDPGYLVLLLSTSAYLSFIEVVARGGTRDRISRSQLGEVQVVAPPIHEQASIVAHVEREAGRMEALVGEAQQAILLLQERRSALISAAVTGKIDVRGLVL
jgi:type I restriction enzyme S subunit